MLTVCRHRLQEAGERRGGQRTDIHLRDRARIFELDRVDAGLGQLAGERAELFGESDEGGQARRLLRADRRHVDRVPDRAARQIVGHLLGDLQGDVLLRLGRRRAEMRRAHDIRRAEEHVLLRRLLDEDVDRRARHLAGIERDAQRLFVDEAAARAVHDPHSRPHLRDRRGVDDVPRLVGERRVQRDEVGAMEERVEVDLLNADLRGALVGEERIIRNHPHLEPERAAAPPPSRCSRSR